MAIDLRSALHTRRQDEHPVVIDVDFTQCSGLNPVGRLESTGMIRMAHSGYSTQHQDTTTIILPLSDVDIRVQAPVPAVFDQDNIRDMLIQPGHVHVVSGGHSGGLQKSRTLNHKLPQRGVIWHVDGFTTDRCTFALRGNSDVFTRVLHEGLGLVESVRASTTPVQPGTLGIVLMGTAKLDIEDGTPLDLGPGTTYVVPDQHTANMTATDGTVHVVELTYLPAEPAVTKPAGGRASRKSAKDD